MSSQVNGLSKSRKNDVNNLKSDHPEQNVGIKSRIS